MKKIIHFTILFIIIIGISACAPKQTTPPTTDTLPPVTDTTPPATTEPTTDLAAVCESNNGKWSAEYKECEGVGPEWCASNGGRFNECASACRHDPKAEVCTMQCVLVCEFNNANANKPLTPPDAKNPPIVGGDRDEHGCIGSAGYQWCENKNKCLRIWEEPCNPEVTSAIQQAFMAKYNKPESEVHVTVVQATNTHARGGVKFGDGTGAGGNFLAKLTDGKWEIVFDGNGSVACKNLEKYQFPKEMIQDICSE